MASGGDFAEEIIQYLQENLELFVEATTAEQQNNLWEELAASLSIRYQTTYEAPNLRKSWNLMKSRAIMKHEAEKKGKGMPLTDKEQEIVELAAGMDAQMDGEFQSVATPKIESVESRSPAVRSGEIHTYSRADVRKRKSTEADECKDVILETFSDLHEKRMASVALKKKLKREMHAKKMECLEAKQRQETERHHKLLELQELEMEQKQRLYEMEVKQKSELFKLRKKHLELNVAMSVIDS